MTLPIRYLAYSLVCFYFFFLLYTILKFDVIFQRVYGSLSPGACRDSTIIPSSRHNWCRDPTVQPQHTRQHIMTFSICFLLIAPSSVASHHNSNRFCFGLFMLSVLWVCRHGPLIDAKLFFLVYAPPIQPCTAHSVYTTFFFFFYFFALKAIAIARPFVRH